MRWRSRWMAVLGGILVVVAAGIVTTVVLWPRHGPVPRARQYTDFSACLVTDPAGVSGQDAGLVWAGMEDASLRTLMKVSFVAVADDRSPEVIRPYVAGLVQKRCDVVVAVGQWIVPAARDSAGAYPQTRFILVGSGVEAPNITLVAPDRSHLRASVAAGLERLAPAK